MTTLQSDPFTDVFGPEPSGADPFESVFGSPPESVLERPEFDAADSFGGPSPEREAISRSKSIDVQRREFDEKYPGGTIGAYEDKRGAWQRFVAGVKTQGLSTLAQMFPKAQHALERTEPPTGKAGLAGQVVGGLASASPGFLNPALFAIPAMESAADGADATLDLTGDPIAAIGSGAIHGLASLIGFKVAGVAGRDIQRQVGELIMTGRLVPAARAILDLGGGAAAFAGADEAALVLDELQKTALGHQDIDEAMSIIRAATPDTLMGGALAGLIVTGGSAAGSALRTHRLRGALREQVELGAEALRTGRNPMTQTPLSPAERSAVESAMYAYGAAARSQGWRDVSNRVRVVRQANDPARSTQKAAESPQKPSESTQKPGESQGGQIVRTPQTASTAATEAPPPGIIPPQEPTNARTTATTTPEGQQQAAGRVQEGPAATQAKAVPEQATARRRIVKAQIDRQLKSVGEGLPSALDAANDIIRAVNSDTEGGRQYLITDSFAITPEDADAFGKSGRMRARRMGIPLIEDATSIREVLGDQLFENALDEALSGHAGRTRWVSDQLLELPENFDAQDVLGAFVVKRWNEVSSPEARADRDILDPGRLREGDAFDIFGEPFEVIRHESGDLVLSSESIRADLPLNQLSEIPADAGTFAPGTPQVAEQRAAERRGRAAREERQFLEEFASPVTTTGLASPDRPLPAPPDKGSTNAERVPVAPIQSTAEPKQIRQIILDLEKNIGRVRRAKPSPRSIGTYYPGSGRTVVKFMGDMDTTAHEIAHRLDDLYGIVAEWAAPRGHDKIGRALPQKSPFDKELRQPVFQQTIRKSYKVVQKRAEGVAEWIRAWMVNPERAARLAPKFNKFFESKVPQHVRDRLRAFGDDIRQWAGSSATQRTLANVEMNLTGPGLAESVRQALSGSPAEFETTWLDNVTSATLDSLAPVFKGINAAIRLRGIDQLLPSKDPRILIRNFAGFNRKFDDVMSNGPLTYKNERVKGIGGFHTLLEPLDQSSRAALELDMADTVALMVNERVIEKARQLDEAAQKVIDLEKEAASLRASAAKAAAEGQNEIAGQMLDDARAKLAEAAKVKKSIGYTGRTSRILGFVEMKKQRLVGTGGGIYSDAKQAAQAIRELTEDPDRYARLSEAAKRYREWADSILRYARDKGRISAESYTAIREKNEQYVALHRLMEEIDPELARASGSRRLASIRDVVQRFRGSTRPIINPYISLIQQSERIMREADRNEALRSFRDLLHRPRGMHQGVPLDLDAIGSRAKTGDADATKVFVDGKAELWQFEEGVHKALRNWGETEPTNIIYRALQFLPRLTHDLITLSPPFIVRNFIRDPMQRSVISRTGSKPWGQLFFLTPEGARQFNDDLSAFYRHGGGMFGHYDQGRKGYNARLSDAMHRALGRKDSILTTPARLGRGYARMAAGSELVGRLAEYRRAFDKARSQLGYDELDAGLFAAFEARGITDYAVGGTAVRQINKYVIFTNAAIQGLARTIRGARENPLRFAARWMAYIVGIELANYLWNWMMGDLEELREQPAYIRDMFWNFKVAPDLWLRIPKPWELGVLASGIGRAIDAASGVDNAFEGWGRSMVGALTPVDESALMGPLRQVGELLSNHDLFRDRPIVPHWEVGLDVELRKGTENASRVGQAIQGAIGMDARQVDHLIESFGGIGRIATAAGDIGKPGAAMQLARETTGITARAPASSARNVQAVFEAARRRGRMNDARVRKLRQMLDGYWAAGTSEERQRLALELRTYAADLRRELVPLWEGQE